MVLELWFDYMVEAGRHPGKWHPDVEREIRPKQRESFDGWYSRTAELFRPTPFAVVGYDSLEEGAGAVQDLLGHPCNEARSSTLVLTVDLRAPNKMLVEGFKKALEEGREKYGMRVPGPGRPAAIYPLAVDYAPNGQVNVDALRKNLRVLIQKRIAPTLSNRAIWDAVVKDYKVAGREQRQIEEARKPADISRRLKQARELLGGVREGCFPDPGRFRGCGVPDW
jgi:hypothetical protein